jgi:predicted nucleic acid-binding protein
MKVALDTSVLVAGLVEAHPHHGRSAWWLRPRKSLERIACWHAFAETWSVLTALPIEPRVTGEVARTVLERLRRVVHFVTPRASVYSSAVERCAGRGLRSGAVYDAIHLVTAEIESADLLLTFNDRDFSRLAETEGPRITVPPDPPGLP